jgi:GNAT superfamily N-acetyltransferase
MVTRECVAVPAARAAELLPILHDAEEDDRRILAALGDPACQAYAMVVNDETVGAAVVRWAEPEVLYLAVAAGHRGKGYGREILVALQAELPARGDRLIVGTANCALDNIAFYQRCGFRMLAVERDHFAYIDPPIRENGIPMRDLIVFSYDLVTGDRPR